MVNVHSFDLCTLSGKTILGIHARLVSLGELALRLFTELRFGVCTSPECINDRSPHFTISYPASRAFFYLPVPREREGRLCRKLVDSYLSMRDGYLETEWFPRVTTTKRSFCFWYFPTRCIKSNNPFSSSCLFISRCIMIRTKTHLKSAVLLPLIALLKLIWRKIEGVAGQYGVYFSGTTTTLNTCKHTAVFKKSYHNWSTIQSTLTFTTLWEREITTGIASW